MSSFDMTVDFLLFLAVWLVEYRVRSSHVEDEGEINCYQLSRSSSFNIDIDEHWSRLRELHVRHNLKGAVVLESGGSDGHQVTVNVVADASSESVLDRLQVTHRLLEVNEWKSILLLQADFAIPFDEGWFSVYYFLWFAAGALVLAAIFAAIWTCYRWKQGRIFSEGRIAVEPGGNMLALTDSQGHFSSPGSFGTPHPSTSVETHPPVSSLNIPMIPLSSSVGQFQSSRAFPITSENITSYRESSAGRRETLAEPSRTSHLLPETGVELRFSSPSSTGSTTRRLETTSILTVMVIALIMTVHTFCVPDHKVQLIIKLPQSLLLDHVKIFYNVKYNNPVDAKAWNKSGSILHIYDLSNVSTTNNPPCDDESVCPGATSDVSACDWFTRTCVCPRGRTMVDELCTPVNGHADLELNLEGLYDHQVRTTASSNLFLENLHDARNLETTYYVTDTKQLTDFFWYRDSGIRVNVGLQNIDVIPTYEDVDHEGDSDFMMQNPSTKSELEYFRNIQFSHCRYPMPDYYSLTLEIAKDRTTKASMEVCTMEEFSAGNCREGLYIGENYIRRELNEPCHKMGSYPEPLLPAANSIVCTESTSLLTAIFNVTSASVHAIPLLSDACRMAGNQCDQCLNQPHCRILVDELDRICCYTECYLRPECKLASSLYCKNPPLECAQGDSYRYTLQPVFSDVRNLYQCHLRRKSPVVLYELWFYVSIPGSNFETPRIYSSVKLSESERKASQGQHQHEFLTVEYSTDIELEEDLVLVGKHQGIGIWNHVVHSVGRSLFSVPQAGILHELAKNVFIASVNFDEPFAFSSSTWVVGDNCRKNVSKFVKLSSHPDVVTQSVSVSINNLLGQRYKYLVKSADSSPNMRVLIPGNTSLLRWWFRDKPPFLIVGSSLQVGLTFNGSSMMINAQGFLTGCPGYMGIVIEDLLTAAEIVKYDILVSCPQQFNIVFIISNQDPSIDHTVEVQIDDAKHISQFILAYSPTFEQQSSKMTFVKDWKVAVFITFGLLTLLFTCSLSSIFLAAVCWTCSKSLWLACQKILGKKFEASRTKQNIQIPISEGNCSSKFGDSRQLTFRSMNMHQRILLVLYIVSKILTIIFCTFTVFFILLNAFISQKTTDISDAVDKLHTITGDKMSQYQHALEEQVELDLMQQEEFFRKVFYEELQCLQTILDTTNFHLHNLTKAFNASSIVADKLRGRIYRYLKSVDNFTDRYRKTFDNDIHSHMNNFLSYLNLQVHNQWLVYPRRLFNLSLSARLAKNLAVSSKLPSEERALNKITVLFWDFIGVQDVLRTQSWPTSFWNKYFEMMSSSVNLNRMSPTRDYFCLKNSSSRPMMWNFSMFHMINSTRFFTTSWKMDQKSHRWPNSNTYFHIQTNGYRNGFPSYSTHREHSDSFSLVSYLHVDFFRIVFFFIDIILLLQRCTQLYLQTQSMFIGFKCRTVLGPSQFWRLRLAVELNGGFSPPSLRRQANNKQISSKMFSQNPDKSLSDGILLVTRPTSSLRHPYTIVTCNDAISMTHDSSYTSLQMGSNSFSTARSDEAESSKGLLFYFNVLLQSLLLQRLETAVLVVLLHFILLTSVERILMSFTGCYTQMMALYQDLVNLSSFLSEFSWQHLIQVGHWHKACELSEFHASLSSLLTFAKEQEEVWRNDHQEICSLFPDNQDEMCNSSNLTDGGFMHEDFTRIKFPCSYSFNHSRLNSLPEISISCVKNLSVLARSADDVITAYWQVLLSCVLLIVLLHAFGTVILHFVKKCSIFPVRYIYETSSSGISHSSSASHIDKSMGPYDFEKNEVVNCKLELPAVYRITSSTTPETSPSSDSNLAALNRRSRVRFAPTVQISSANSSFGSIPTQMQLEMGYAESNV